MVNSEGKRICDKEIHGKDGAWKGCRKPATVTKNSRAVPYLEIDYCAKHAPKA